jgi:hypothetical protein
MSATHVGQELQRAGRVRPGALDERCMDNLARLPDQVQVQQARTIVCFWSSSSAMVRPSYLKLVLRSIVTGRQVAACEEFASKDLSQARNMAALFTSVIKVIMNTHHCWAPIPDCSQCLASLWSCSWSTGSTWTLTRC